MYDRHAGACKLLKARLHAASAASRRKEVVLFCGSLPSSIVALGFRHRTHILSSCCGPLRHLVMHVLRAGLVSIELDLDRLLLLRRLHVSHTIHFPQDLRDGSRAAVARHTHLLEEDFTHGSH